MANTIKRYIYFFALSNFTYPNQALLRKGYLSEKMQVITYFVVEWYLQL